MPDKYWSPKSHHWYVHPILEKLKANIIPFVIKQERLITAKIKLLSKRLAAAYFILPKIKSLKHSFWTWSLRTTESEQFLLEGFFKYKTKCLFSVLLLSWTPAKLFSFGFQPQCTSPVFQLSFTITSICSPAPPSILNFPSKGLIQLMFCTANFSQSPFPLCSPSPASFTLCSPSPVSFTFLLAEKRVSPCPSWYF